MEIDIAIAAARHIDDIEAAATGSDLSHWSRSDYLAELARPESIFLAATEAGGRAVGFIVGRVVPDALSDSLITEIHNIAVLGEYRRLGVGSRLLQAFTKHAKKRLAREVFLEVRAGNIGAIAFYSKHGFEPYLSRSSYYANPLEDATLMRSKI